MRHGKRLSTREGRRYPPRRDPGPSNRVYPRTMTTRATTAPATNKPVCVTGASGFIAAHIVRDLLARGYRVRGTVRNPDRNADLAFLTGLPGAAERLELLAGDLLEDRGWDAAVAGCECVMHTASPYQIAVDDPQRDLVDPAVQGTRRVLDACRRADVRRVVLTSSMAAITDEPDAGHVLTEADWNTKSTLDRNPYYFSKVLAEREAWKIVDEEKAGFELVVINPFMVIGPSLSPGLNTSTKILADLANGVYPGILALTWGLVDVRDVSEAHVRAMETSAASGRYLCAGERLTMREVVGVLREIGVRGKLPSLGLDNAAGTALVKVLARFQPKGVSSYLRSNLGRVPVYDNGKIRRGLGLAFRPARTSIRDTVEDLRQRGLIQTA
jgi:dihydroflavonol-4-reductase